MLVAQLKAQARLISALYAPVLITLIAIACYALWTDTPSAFLTEDPAAIMNVNPFYGTLSKLGVLLWCASGTICLFSAALLRREIHKDATPAFLISAGILTFLLLLDDLFMLHEQVVPTYLHLPQIVVYVVYGVTLSMICVWFRKTILGTRFALLLIAISFFASSTVVDLLPLDRLSGRSLIEDGLKMLGIVSWFGYFAGTCLQQVEIKWSLVEEGFEPIEIVS